MALLTTLLSTTLISLLFLTASALEFGEETYVKRYAGPHNRYRRQLPQASWGHTVYLDATKSEYMYMSAIFQPGKPVGNPKGSTFLWPGLFDRNQYTKTNLIQSVTELHGAAQNKQTCGAGPGQWCVRPFVVDYSAKPLSAFPPRGEILDPTDKIQIEYIKAPGENGNWTQKITNLSKGNKVLFNWVRSYKKTNRLHIATEYQGGAAPTIDTQHYWNITLTLKEAEPGVGKAYTVSPKSITATKPYTKDEGKTWQIDHVELPPGKKAESVKALAEEEGWDLETAEEPPVHVW